MAHKSFAKDVLSKTLLLASTSKGEVSCGDISSALFIQTRVQHKKLLNTLSELSRTGKLRRIRQGVYGPVAGVGQLDKQEVMYRMLRIQKRMTVDDMVESVEGVSRAYVLEFFQWLAREGWVRKIPTRNNAGIYVLIKNELEMPVNDQKAAKLRELRRKKKAALSGKLDEIDSAVKSARNILKSLEDE